MELKGYLPYCWAVEFVDIEVGVRICLDSSPESYWAGTDACEFADRFEKIFSASSFFPRCFQPRECSQVINTPHAMSFLIDTFVDADNT